MNKQFKQKVIDRWLKHQKLLLLHKIKKVVNHWCKQFYTLESSTQYEGLFKIKGKKIWMIFRLFFIVWFFAACRCHASFHHLCFLSLLLVTHTHTLTKSSSIPPFSKSLVWLCERQILCTVTHAPVDDGVHHSPSFPHSSPLSFPCSPCHCSTKEYN